MIPHQLQSRYAPHSCAPGDHSYNAESICKHCGSVEPKEMAARILARVKAQSTIEYRQAVSNVAMLLFQHVAPRDVDAAGPIVDRAIELARHWVDTVNALSVPEDLNVRVADEITADSTGFFVGGLGGRIV